MLTTYALHLHDHRGKRLVPILAQSVAQAMHQSREVFFADASAHLAELHVGNGSVFEWHRR